MIPAIEQAQVILEKYNKKTVSSLSCKGGFRYPAVFREAIRP